MKNTKKVLSVALAGALAFGSMGSAFAADAKLTEGIDNKDVVKAIEKLSAFDIVNGMEDGKYHAEGELTRAQFAKMLVEALGLGSAAQNSTHKPAFNDVDASSQWAWGYINVAQGQGLLSGYPDGTFKPSAKVSYAEALTMLVRSLGYKDEFLSGSWPGNYMAKAADVDVTDGVTVDGSAVNRGAAALLLSNTLDANIIKQSTYGDDDNWTVDENTTLIEDKLDVEKYEDAQVIAIPRVEGSIDKDQIKISYKDEDNDDKEKTIDVDLEKVSIDNLLGEGLNVYYDTSAKEVVFVEKSDKEFKTYYDVVDKDEDINKDEFTIVKADKELNLDDDIVYYVDNEKVDQDDFEKYAKGGNLFVKAVANEKGNIAIVDAQKFEKNANGVVAVEADKDKLVFMNDADEDKDDTTTIKAEDFDKVVVMDNNGNTMKLEDIKKDDIVYVNSEDLDGNDLELASSKDEVLQLLVVRDVVKGKAESYKVDVDKKTGTIEIDKKDYDVATLSTISLNEDKDLYEITSSKGKTKLEDVTDEEAAVVALLDVKGDVRHIRTDVDSSSDDLFGIVSGSKTDYDDIKLKIFNKEGKEVEYKLDLDTDGLEGTDEAHLSNSDAVKYDVVKFTVDKDGEIDTLKLLAEVNKDGIATPKEGTVVELADEDINKDDIVIKDGSKTSYKTVEDDVVAFDYTAAYDKNDKIDDIEDVDILKWADLVDNKPGTDAKAIYSVNDSGAIEFIVFTGGFDAGSEDFFAGYVVDARQTSDKDKVDMVVEGTNEVKRYEVDDIEKAVKLKDEMPVIFKKNSDGTIDIVESGEGYKLVEGEVTDKDGSLVTIKGTTYKLSSDAVYYEEDTAKTRGDLDKNDNVIVAVDGNTIKVVELLKDDEVKEDKEETVKAQATVPYEFAVGDTSIVLTVDKKDKTYDVDAKAIIVDKDGKKLAAGTAIHADAKVDFEVKDGSNVIGFMKVKEDNAIENGIKAEIAAAEKKIADATKEKEVAEAKVTAADEKVAAATQEKTDAEAKVTAADNKINAAQAIIDGGGTLEEKTDAIADKKAATTEKEAAEAEVTAADDKLTEAKAEKTAAEGEVTAAEKKIADATKEKEDAEAKLKA